MPYYKLNPKSWKEDWYYDYRLNEAFPQLNPDKFYNCISIMESDNLQDSILRCIIDESSENFVYIPERFMIAIVEIRDDKINEIIE